MTYEEKLAVIKEMCDMDFREISDVNATLAEVDVKEIENYLNQLSLQLEGLLEMGMI